jgi:hypothetical protein
MPKFRATPVLGIAKRPRRAIVMIRLAGILSWRISSWSSVMKWAEIVGCGVTRSRPFTQPRVKHAQRLTLRRSGRAKLRLLVKRILRKYKHSSLKEDAAVALVMLQAEILSTDSA